MPALLRWGVLAYCLAGISAQAVEISSFAGTNAFTVTEYVQAVLALDPQVSQARNAFDATKYQWISRIGQAALPTLSFTDTGYPYGHNPANGYRFNTWRLKRSDMSKTTVVNWTLFNSFQDYEGVRYAAQAKDTAEYALRSKEQSRAFQALQVFYQLGLSNRLLEVDQGNLSTQQDQYAVTQDLYQHGMKSLADLLKGETDLHSAELLVANAEADQKTSLLQFNALLDRPSDRSIELHMDLELGSTDLPRLADDMGQALTRRPEILQDQSALRQSETALTQSVQSNLLPTVTLNGTWNRQDIATFGLPPSAFGIPNPNYYIGLSLSLPVGFNVVSQAANVASALSAKRLAADQLRDETRLVRQDVAAAYIQLEKSYKDYRISALKEDIAKRALDVVAEEFKQGTADAIRLAQAQQDYLDAQVSLSQALHDSFINRAQYRYAIGESPWK